MVGWSFDVLQGRLTEDVPPWDFEDECVTAMATAGRVLDMGTGGGERLIALCARLEPDAQRRSTIVATEGWEPNLGVADAALAPFGIDVVRYDAEDPMDRVPFADASFDLVMNRHEAYEVAEVERVLAPGGVFLTQQVDGRDTHELYDWFGGSSSYPDVVLERHRADAEAAGLVVDSAQEWSGQTRFADATTLVEYLGLAPFIVLDFDVDKQAETLARLDSQRPIVVTQRRFRLGVSKRSRTPT